MGSVSVVCSIFHITPFVERGTCAFLYDISDMPKFFAHAFYELYGFSHKASKKAPQAGMANRMRKHKNKDNLSNGVNRIGRLSFV